jgi:cytochrome P450
MTEKTRIPVPNITTKIQRTEGFPIVGVLPQLWQMKPLSFLVNAAREHGDVARLKMGPGVVYLVSHPDDIKHILLDNNRNYRKGYEKVTPVLGHGLVTSEGDFWLRQRRLIQPAFHKQTIASMTELMTGLIQETLQAWETKAEQGEPVDVANEMMKLMQHIIVRSMFGINVPVDPDRMGRAFDDALRFMNQFIMVPLDIVRYLPTLTNLRFRRAIKFLDSVVYQMIEERERGKQESDDLLSMLIHARDEESGEGMTRQQIRDEIMTIYLAGHETTANAMAWAWYLLSKHSHVRQQLEAEVDSVLGQRTPALDDLRHLRYTRMVVDETLRLRPPAWMFARRAIGDDTLRGYPIPAGALVMLSPYVTHHRPDLWENPEGFEPERFEPGKEKERAKFAYFPFGGGPRICIGNNFSLMESQLTLAMVTQRFRLDLLPGQRVEPRPIATLQPHPGVMVQITRRS